jgi:hypothetical protein
MIRAEVLQRKHSIVTQLMECCNKLIWWLDVDSAFNLMGIYKLKCLKHCCYELICDITKVFPDTGVEYGLENCEHVFLNKLLKNRGYSLAISPALYLGNGPAL